MPSTDVICRLMVFSAPSLVSAASCSGAIDLIASDLAGYASAQSFCSSKFPVPKATASAIGPAKEKRVTIEFVVGKREFSERKK